MFRPKLPKAILTILVVTVILSVHVTAVTQEKKPPQMPRGPVVNSPEVMPDGRVAFRILAPKAESVGLQASDIPGLGRSGPQFKKDEDGVWEATVGPINPGAYRYRFMMDEVAVIDPRNPSISESNGNSWSLVYIPGAEFMDNLIAAKKVRPMIVVMPAGHTSAAFRMGGGSGSMVDEFSQDFVKDIMPYVETNYRVLTDRRNRAMAGLSMGGMQTLNVTMSDLGKFSYIGVFSSGVFGMAPKKPKPEADTSPKAEPSVSWEEEHQSMLDNASLTKDLKLLWFATGTDDFLVETTRTTVEMLKKHGFSPVYKESAGGHTWINWREYLNEFAPLLFR